MRPIDADAPIEIVEGGLRNNPHKDGHARVCHRAEYTHFLDVIQRMSTIAQPPDDPLTLEQLREMNGEPVWVVRGEGEGRWALIRFVNNYGVGTHGCGFLGFEDWQVDWWAYRRKPEEG